MAVVPLENANNPKINLDIMRLICQLIVLESRPDNPKLLIDPYIRIKRPSRKKNNKDDDGEIYSYSDRTVTLQPNPLVQAQETLKNLCLVSKAWNYEARKALWSSGIQFGLPRSFELVVKMVDPIGSFFDGGNEPAWLTSPPASRNRSTSSHISCTDPNQSCVTSSASSRRYPEYNKDSSSIHRSISLVRKDGDYILQPHIPLDQDSEHLSDQERSLSPRPVAGKPTDRTTRKDNFESIVSPIRGRVAVQSLSRAFRRASVTSPIRRQVGSPESVEFGGKTLGEVLRGENEEEAEGEEEEEFIFDPQVDDIFNPGPYITSISFSKYRSHGMRRSVAEGNQSRFCTPERLNRLLKSTRSRYASLGELGLMNTERSREDGTPPHVLIRKGKLEAVGFSEYMDSAISKEVLDEILLRGGVEVEYERLKLKEEDSGAEENITITIDQVEDLSRGRKRTRKNLQLVSKQPILHRTIPAPVLTSYNSAYSASSSTLTALPLSDQQDYSGSSKLPVQIERRLESSLLMETPIRALDLCGCISPRFRTSLNEFISDHALSTPHLPQHQAQSSLGMRLDLSGPRLRSTAFPHLTRLGLSRMIVFSDLELANFLSGFVNLLDLDISHTRAGPIVLHTLQLVKRRTGQAEDGREWVKRPSFRSLNLAKCRGLTRESLIGFLCGEITEGDDVGRGGGGGGGEGQEGEDGRDGRWEDPMESIGELEELSLYGDSTLPTPLDSNDLRKILRFCPSFRSGRLTTLDLSSISIDDREIDLSEETPDQPNLLQFGIGSCSNISLDTVSRLLMRRMRSVEILDISFSCFKSRQRTRFEEREGYLRTVPAISVGKLHEELIDKVCRFERAENGQRRRMTNLRVIELEDVSLKTIRGGARGWKVAFGKGQRGWYVDLTVKVKVITLKDRTRERKVQGIKEEDEDEEDERVKGPEGFSKRGYESIRSETSKDLKFKRVVEPIKRRSIESFLEREGVVGLGEEKKKKKKVNNDDEDGGFHKSVVNESREESRPEEEVVVGEEFDDDDDDESGLERSLLTIKSIDETIRHTEIGWMSRKTEILYGSGMVGRQDGLYGFHGYSNT